MALFKTERKFSENPLLDPNHRSSQIHLFGMLNMIYYNGIEDMDYTESFRFNIKHADFHRYKLTADQMLLRELSIKAKLLRRPTPVEKLPMYSHQSLRVFTHIREADNDIR